MNVFLVASLGIAALALGFLAVRQRKQLIRLRTELARIRVRVGPILDLDAEKAAVQASIEQLAAERQRATEDFARERAKLTEQYTAALATYERLRREIALLEENLEDISFGLYKPHFDFRSSEEYKAALEAVRDRQREMIRAGQAAVCDTKWTVGGSAREGGRMAKQYSKLVLRAFNGECDAAVANVTWNNVVKMEERIRKSFEALNKLGTVMQVRITEPYLKLKLAFRPLALLCQVIPLGYRVTGS